MYFVYKDLLVCYNVITYLRPQNMTHIAFTSLTSDWRSLTVLTKSSKRPALVDQTKFLQKIKKLTRQKPDGWQYCRSQEEHFSKPGHHFAVSDSTGRDCYDNSSMGF